MGMHVHMTGRKLSRISQCCGYLWKFSLQNLGARCPLARKIEESANVFSLKTFLLYSIHFSAELTTCINILVVMASSRKRLKCYIQFRQANSQDSCSRGVLLHMCKIIIICCLSNDVASDRPLQWSNQQGKKLYFSVTPLYDEEKCESSSYSMWSKLNLPHLIQDL